MEEDGDINPGSKTFWDAFYSDDGTIQQKQKSLERLVRRSEFDPSQSKQASLLGHYEWFTTFDVYREAVCAAVRASCLLLTRPADHQDPKTTSNCSSVNRTLRVLHVGCGSSDFADHVEGAVREVLRTHEREGAFASNSNGGAGRRRHTELVPSQLEVDVVNMDICAALVETLTALFPRRTYAVGDCCDMVDPIMSSSRWWWCADAAAVLSSPSSYGHRLLKVQRESVDLIFDKGTMDALLSGFAGEVNPNASKYTEQSLQLLRDGGAMIVISINSETVLMPYFFEAGAQHDSNDENDNGSMHGEPERRYFALKSTEVLDVSEQFQHAPQEARLRVETLGDRYSVYCFVACRSDDE